MGSHYMYISRERSVDTELISPSSPAVLLFPHTICQVLSWSCFFFSQLLFDIHHSCPTSVRSSASVTLDPGSLGRLSTQHVHIKYSSQ